MSKVTIVVPVYNVEAYIAKCLDSLLMQDNADYEVLVVNDGSPANEQPIIDSYAQKDARIHSVVKENGGYGSVLEYAIENIKSEYMLVCDPDDYLYPHTLSTLVKLIEEKHCDIAIGAKTLVYSDNEEEKYDKSFNEAYAQLQDGSAYDSDDVGYDHFYFVDPSPHAKLYRVSLLKDAIFPHKISFTDNILYFHALNKASRVVYTSEALAYYLINRVGNTMTDIRITAIDAEIKMLSSLISHNRNANAIFYYRMFEAYKYIYNEKINRCNASEKEVRERLQSLYNVVALLLPKRVEILHYYDLYNKYPVIEKMRDHLLLNKFFTVPVYDRMIRKKLKERWK